MTLPESCSPSVLWKYYFSISNRNRENHTRHPPDNPRKLSVDYEAVFLQLEITWRYTAYIHTNQYPRDYPLNHISGVQYSVCLDWLGVHTNCTSMFIFIYCISFYSSYWLPRPLSIPFAFICQTLSYLLILFSIRSSPEKLGVGWLFAFPLTLFIFFPLYIRYIISFIHAYLDLDYLII